MIDRKIDLSVIIPSLNGERHLKEFLVKNLRIIQTTLERNSKYNQIEMIIIDDNSTDRTLDYLKQTAKEFDFLRFGTNPKQGISSARNFGVSISSLERHGEGKYKKYLLFIDNDVLLSDDFFTSAEKYLRKDPFSVTCRGVNYYTKSAQDGAKIIEFKRGFFRFSRNIFPSGAQAEKKAAIPSFGAQGAYFFVKLEDFIELSGFDENFDPYVLEESDLIYRGLKRGKECIFAEEAIAYHKVGGTIKSKTSKKTKLLSKRNRIYFIWKNTHSRFLLLQHLLFLPTSLLSPQGAKAFIKAIPMLKKAIILNKKERNKVLISDHTILNRSKHLKKTAQG